MRLNRKTIFALALIIIFIGSCGGKDESGAKAKNGNAGGSKLKWLSFNEGYALAQKEKKVMLVDFYADWCKWCIVMDSETFSDTDVINKLNESYITVRVHTDKEDGEKIRFNGRVFTNQGFASLLGVQGLPTVMFFDKQGSFLTKIPGFVKKDMLLPVLDYLALECYSKSISFDDYMSGKADCKTK